MKNIVIFGTGTGAEKVIKSIDFKNYNIIAFIDNNELKQGQLYKGIKIMSPKDLKDMEYDYIIICSVYFKEIYKQLVDDYSISPSKLENNLFFVKEKLVDYYKTQRNNKEINEILDYLKNNDLNVFNYNFAKQYENQNIEVCYDDNVKLFYVNHNSKRMYFKKSLKNENEIIRYYRSICIEQDEESPHRYLTNECDVKIGDVVIDAGVAEGNFALDIIDKVSKIYLIESDEEWIEALKETFKEYKDKVIIVDKFLTDFNNDKNITIDKLIGNEKVDFIKMDIEGGELSALRGAKSVISNNENLQLDICVYHNFEDEKKIREFLSELDCKTKTSNGYMFFVNDEIYEDNNPRLVKGLIRV